MRAPARTRRVGPFVFDLRHAVEDDYVVSGVLAGSQTVSGVKIPAGSKLVWDWCSMGGPIRVTLGTEAEVAGRRLPAGATLTVWPRNLLERLYGWISTRQWPQPARVDFDE